VSSYKSVDRDLLRASCSLAGRGVATVFLVALLAIFASADFASAEIIANLQPIAGAPGNYADTVSYSIADIDTAGGILIGDKLFDSFSVASASSPDAVAPLASGIEITAVEVNGSYGFKVNSLWIATGGEWVDSTIQYHVGVTSQAAAQGLAIDGNALYTTGVGSAGGVVSIAESLYAQYPGSGASSVADEFNYYVSSTNKQTQDSAVFAPLTSLWVVKDIGVSGGSGSGVAHLSEFYQTFQQAPEPSTLVLSAVGVFGLAAFAWRKRRAA
jgi:hypothetical protein